MTFGGKDLGRRTDKLRKAWAKQAPRYDKSMGFFERRLFGQSHRPWACAQATGKVLEVAVGTGLNLEHYPSHVDLSAIDLSPEMLDIARSRAKELGRGVDLREGDAHDLPFADGSFDTVVCTYALCNIPDPGRAIREMKRVLRSGGQLILVDHIRSNVRVVYWGQKLIELFSARLSGDHMTRRPAREVESEGFNFSVRERRGWAGMVERLVAIRP